MKRVYLSYNPYLVKTEMKIDDQDIMSGPDLPFYKWREERIQRWLEPIERENWRGFLGELRSVCNSEEIELTFHGTALDFQDIEDLVRRERECHAHFKQIDLIHENEAAARKSNPKDKLEGLKEIYEDIKEKTGLVPEFRTKKIKQAFQRAINSNFEIVVIAPMSSGKSTLINAILGGDVLPAINQATTAVITYIRDVDGKKQFTVSAVDRHGKELCKKGGEPATLKRITELNGTIDPEDPEKKRALAKKIVIEGDIKTLPAQELHTVFVDTPGGNNSLNREHGAVMEKAIHNENKSMVLYVFNGTQVSTNDNAAILKKIANAMKQSVNGKQSRDRFLFVVNRMDDFETEKESYEDVVKTIKKSLAGVGITEPNLFLVSAQTAKLMRMHAANTPFTESEDDQYEALCKKMTRESRQLYEYSSLTESQKAAFRAQEKQLREENPGEKSIPEIAEINSGIPAVELAIREYLEKYALAIKVKEVHDSFMGDVQDKHVLDTYQKKAAESDKNFEEAKREVEELQKKLKEERTLPETLQKIDEIQLDKEPYQNERSRMIQHLQRIQREHSDQDEVEKEAAQELLHQLESEVSGIEGRFESMADRLADDLAKQCRLAMRKYSENIEKFRERGLLDIGGIKVDQLAVFKKLDRTARVSMEEYTAPKDIYQTFQIKDPGFFNGLKRLFGMGGVHPENRKVGEKEYVNFTDFVRNALGQLESSISNYTDEMIEKAEELVEGKKDEARKLVQEMKKLIQDIADECEEKLQSREKLKQENEREKETFEYADQIIKKVKSILDV